MFIINPMNKNKKLLFLEYRDSQKTATYNIIFFAIGEQRYRELTLYLLKNQFLQ